MKQFIGNIIDEIIDIWFWLKNRKEIQKQMVIDEKQFNNTVVELNRAKKKNKKCENCKKAIEFIKQYQYLIVDKKAKEELIEILEGKR